MSAVNIYSFNWMDCVYVGVLVLSMIFGAFRGFSRSLLSFVIWILAFVIPGVFGGLVAPLFSGVISQPNGRLFLAMGLLFVVVFIVGWILSWIIGKSIQDSELAGADRFLGFIFGFFRGMALLAIVTALVMLTTLSQAQVWQKSVLVGGFNIAIENVLGLFPTSWTNALDSRIWSNDNNN